MNRAFIVWLVLCLIWGSTWIFIKLGLRDPPPITFAGLRFAVAAAILWAMIVIQRRKPSPDAGDWRLLFYTGLLAFTVNCDNDDADFARHAGFRAADRMADDR